MRAGAARDLERDDVLARLELRGKINIVEFMIQDHEITWHLC